MGKAEKVPKSLGLASSLINRSDYWALCVFLRSAHDFAMEML